MTAKNLISWVEIPATDFNRAVTFYSTILQVKLEAMDFGEEKMACLPNGEGAVSQAPGFKPSNQGVIVSLHAENGIDPVLERIKTSGGKIVREKTKIEAEDRGYFALFEDSEGNRLGLYSDN